MNRNKTISIFSPSSSSPLSRLFSSSSSPLHPQSQSHIPMSTISSKLPYSPLFRPSNNPSSLNPIKIPSLSPSPHKLLFFKPITIQRIPTKPPNSSSSPSPPLQSIDELPPKLLEIIKLFQGVEGGPKAKYEQLLFYGRNLNPLDSKYKTSENKVQGCVSQVWVRAYLDEDKNVVFEADSDSLLTKGLAALLVQGLSGRPVEEILRVSPGFVGLLGLQQSLTPSRNNGFLNMLKLMQKKAVQLVVEGEKGEGESNQALGGESSVESLSSGAVNGGNGGVVNGLDEDGLDKDGSEKDSENGSLLGSRGMRIKEVLERELRPFELKVEDISYQHAGHAGVRGSDGETHFNVRVVSDEFEGKSLVKRHRLIYGLLGEELQNGLHALSIEAKTPAEVGSQ